MLLLGVDYSLWKKKQIRLLGEDVEEIEEETRPKYEVKGEKRELTG